MPSLENIDGRSLVPDMSQSLNMLFNDIEQGRERKRLEEQDSKVDYLLGQLGAEESDPNQILIGLAQIDPSLVKQVMPLFDRRDQQELSAAKAEMEKNKARTLRVLKAKDDNSQIREIQNVVSELIADGADEETIDEAVGLANLSMEQRNARLESQLLKGDILNREIEKYLTPQETFQTLTDANGNVTGQKSSKTGKIVSHPNAVKTEAQMAQKLEEARAGKSETFIQNEIRNAGSKKGPQTDKDQERIAKTLPNIGNEKLANQFNINSLKALNDRKIEMAAFYENYLEENETLRGADKAWSKFKRETPMLSDNVIDPNTGLPMFFNEFKAKARERNPSASDEQIIKSWRKLANGK